VLSVRRTSFWERYDAEVEFIFGGAANEAFCP
jgi:hypothetical protein